MWRLCENNRQQKLRNYTVVTERYTERWRNRLLVCVLITGLVWVRLINQGVVANRRGAGPTMTILECYYTKIRTLNIRLHQWAHKKIVLYVDLSLTPTFVLNGLFLCSLLSSLGAFSLIWRNFCSAMTALDLKSFLRFWLLSDRDKATHTNTERETEWGRRKGG